MADALPSPDSIISAGYAYLGQFIFHDIAYSKLKPLKSHRSPALDLDSVLNADASDGGNLELLRLGFTTTIGAPCAEDLPRRCVDAGKGRPRIADNRNDDLLPLAQCHMVLLKFYNAIARWMGFGRWPGTPDEAAVFGPPLGRPGSSISTRSSSTIIFPRIAGTEIHGNVLRNGRRIVRRDICDAGWLPLELTTAIGRYGHGMVRESYRRWNRHRDGQTTRWVQA